MLDLSKFSTKALANAGVRMVIMRPDNPSKPLADDAGNEAALILAGADSDVYRKAQRANLDKRLNVQGRGAQVKVTAAEVEENAMNLMVAVVLGFENIAIDGKPLEHSKANVRKLLEDYPFIREQVDSFINDRAAYLGNS